MDTPEITTRWWEEGSDFYQISFLETWKLDHVPRESSSETGPLRALWDTWQCWKNYLFSLTAAENRWLAGLRNVARSPIAYSITSHS